MDKGLKFWKPESGEHAITFIPLSDTLILYKTISDNEKGVSCLAEECPLCKLFPLSKRHHGN